MSAVTNRLERRRAELLWRFQRIDAADELSEPGGEIAFYALRDELEFLTELYEVMLLEAIHRRVSSDVLTR